MKVIFCILCLQGTIYVIFVSYKKEWKEVLFLKANMEIRLLLTNNRLKNWEVANKMGIADTTLSRWLRTPLSDERKERVLTAIDELKKEVS